MTLDQSAINYINAVVPKDKYFRVSISSGGCNGFTYNYNVVDAPTPNDIVLQDNIILDKRSSLLLKGSVLKYIRSLEGSMLQMVNPNATSECGCKSSFSV